MKWNHLPVRGGVYDQHPVMLDHFIILFDLEAQARQRQQARESAKMKSRK